MKNIKYIILLLISLNYSKIFASSNDAGILGGVSVDEIRRGDIHVEDIPGILIHAINFLMGIAGTVAIVFIIIGAYRILLGSLDNNKTKGKETIMYALAGFVVASLSWIILKVIIDNFA